MQKIDDAGRIHFQSLWQAQKYFERLTHRLSHIIGLNYDENRMLRLSWKKILERSAQPVRNNAVELVRIIHKFLVGLPMNSQDTTVLTL
jgi:hypothetical protein